MIAWLVEALAASALLMIAVMLLRAPMRRIFGPQVAYALWILPALRLLMPPLPEAWSRAAATPISAAGEAVVLILPMNAAATPAAEAGAGPPWGAVLLATWALGAAGLFLFHLLRHRAFCRRLLGQAHLVGELDGVSLVESPAAAGPLAFGVMRRYVAFPADIADRYDADERALALAHELGHHARRDLHANWAALGLLALHWWNPVAWAAHRAFRCDQELANDARVLAGRSRTDRHVYACAIVKAAHGGALAPACHLHTIADLKGRLRMLSTLRPSRARLATGSAAMIGLVATGLVATASGTRAAAAVSERIEAAADVAFQAAPAAPPAPAVPPTAATPPASEAPKARTVKRVVVVKEGETTTYEGAEAEAYAARHGLPVPPVPPEPGAAPAPPAPPFPPAAFAGVDGKPFRVFMRRHGTGDYFAKFPEVSQRVCIDGRDGESRQTILNSEKDGKRTVVICTNRLQFMTADAATAADLARTASDAAARAAERGEWAGRRGLETALASIASARASIRTNRDLTPEQRRQALNGLDDATRELRDELRLRN